MRIEQNFSLENYNTFRLPVKTRWFMEYENEEELQRILRDEYFQELCSLHIGRGSNLLFLNDYNGIILHSAIKGTDTIFETESTVLLRIGAAEIWDDVVAYAVANGWGGIENLSLIPGEAGAAAVQNIGAYGVEIKDVIESVEACNQLTFEKKTFTSEACRYAYRHSYFKDEHHDPYIITHITLRLQKNPGFKLSYADLKEKLAGFERLTPLLVRNAVMDIRREKLPDPEEIGNAGSFFMNPVVSQERYEKLKQNDPSIPAYFSKDGQIKLSAGWLIDQCGLKGKRFDTVGIYEKQALVIVNLGNATGHEIALLAEHIRNEVEQRFGILL
ncbi:MAG: UDP-N-acetylmuramate dehydrogenase, partial [Tannerella sp.]|nr:UDP-N-acetylmuramate dehydrogenase [Tannerella sp.]